MPVKLVAHRILSSRTSTRLSVGAVLACVAASTLLIPNAVAAAATAAEPTVKSLNVHSGGTWGYNLVTITGTNFTGSSKVAYVLFGGTKAHYYLVHVLSATTIQARSPEAANYRHVVDVSVVLRNGKKSATRAADHFIYVVPTMNTPLKGHWSAATSRRVANSMIGRARRVNAQPVAHNPGYWTPAMGKSAVHRAANWLGMPYTFPGGDYNGPTYGNCYGDGLIGKFDCTFRGFDCSGLTLYAWAKYRHLAHYSETQHWQAGVFHPKFSELQPGDLMFWSEGEATSSHVTMYAGGGKVIQASWSGFPLRYNTIAQVKTTHPRYLGATRPMTRGNQGRTPVITSLSKSTSATAGGSTITLHGRYLSTASRVFFGSTGTYAFSVKDWRTVTVKVPAHAAGRTAVRIDTGWGQSRTTIHARMTYVAAPKVTSAAPSKGTTAGGTTVRLTGKSFVAGAKVYFGAKQGSKVKLLSSTALIVVSPAKSAGRVTVTVTTAYGSGKRAVFTYVTPKPARKPATKPSTATSSPPVTDPPRTPSSSLIPSSSVAPSSSPSILTTGATR